MILNVLVLIEWYGCVPTHIWMHQGQFPRWVDMRYNENLSEGFFSIMVVFLSKFLYIFFFSFCSTDWTRLFFYILYAHSQTKSDGIASSTADA